MAKGRKHKEVVDEARQIARDIKARQFKPVYLLHGEEPYYIDVLTKLFAENVLEEHERDFNQSILYASDVKPLDVLALARQYPVMSEYQVIIVKEAQQWRSFDDLKPMLTHPIPTTLLVICHKGKNFDKRTTFYKEFSKVGVAFQSDKLSDWDVTPWIHKYCADHKMHIEDRAAALLSDHIGADLINLSNALEKLASTLEDGGMITSKAVLENVGISKDFNVFELNKALGQRNTGRALLIANHFANNEKEHHIIPTTSAVYNYFRKIATYQELARNGERGQLASALGVHPNFITEYANAASRYPLRSLVKVFETLHDIDLKSKGVGSANASGGQLVKEMVGRILHA